MCSTDCFRWACQHARAADIEGKRIVEVGSCDVNGSLRHVYEMLAPAEYIGTDIETGSGVDLICPAQELTARFGENSFDVVVSACSLEHIRDWRAAVSNMKRVCKPGGLIFIIVPSVWSYHAHPGDYWRFSPEDIRQIFGEFNVEHIEEDPRPPSLVYARLRKPSGEFKEIDLTSFEAHSIVCGKKVRDITDADFQSAHFRKTLLKYKLKNWGLNFGQRLFRQV